MFIASKILKQRYFASSRLCEKMHLTHGASYKSAKIPILTTLRRNDVLNEEIRKIDAIRGKKNYQLCLRF
jgi:hypothetical protein